MRLVETVALIAATITVGLMAGVFVSFSVAVMPGLSRAHDRTFVDAMQRINVAILNGWFLTCFLGGLVLSGLAMVLWLVDGRPGSAWVIAGFALYAATIAITAAVNVPLNNELDAAGPVANIGDLAVARQRFEPTWVRWNAWRTLTNVASFGCLCWALLLYGQAGI
jgi:uncharacterized membrane protein